MQGQHLYLGQPLVINHTLKRPVLANTRPSWNYGGLSASVGYSHKARSRPRAVGYTSLHCAGFDLV